MGEEESELMTELLRDVLGSWAGEELLQAASETTTKG